MGGRRNRRATVHTEQRRLCSQARTHDKARSSASWELRGATFEPEDREHAEDRERVRDGYHPWEGSLLIGSSESAG